MDEGAALVAIAPVDQRGDAAADALRMLRGVAVIRPILLQGLALCLSHGASIRRYLVLRNHVREREAEARRGYAPRRAWRQRSHAQLPALDALSCDRPAGQSGQGLV